MNIRTRETVVAMRALRLMADGWKAGAGCSDIYDHRLDQYCRDDAKTLGDAVEIALYRYEQQAREEIRRELGEEPDGVATISSETLRRCAGDADTDPKSGLTYGGEEL